MATNIRLKPCIQCGRVQRDKRGECLPCKRAANRVWRAKRSEMAHRLSVLDVGRPAPSLELRPGTGITVTRYRRPPRGHSRKEPQDSLDWLAD